MVIGMIILLLWQNTLKGICTHICWMMTDWMDEQMNKDARNVAWIFPLLLLSLPNFTTKITKY